MVQLNVVDDDTPSPNYDEGNVYKKEEPTATTRKRRPRKRKRKNSHKEAQKQKHDVVDVIAQEDLGQSANLADLSIVDDDTPTPMFHEGKITLHVVVLY